MKVRFASNQARHCGSPNHDEKVYEKCARIGGNHSSCMSETVEREVSTYPKNSVQSSDL